MTTRFASNIVCVENVRNNKETEYVSVIKAYNSRGKRCSQALFRDSSIKIGCEIHLQTNPYLGSKYSYCDI